MRRVSNLENRTDRDCLILEIGDRSRGDVASYPQDDLRALMNVEGNWRFARKDGTCF